MPAVHALVTAAYQHYVPRVGRKPGPMLVGYDAILPLPAHRVWVLEDGHAIVALLHIIVKSDQSWSKTWRLPQATKAAKLVVG